MATRVNINLLVEHHGARGLARKLGVSERSVHRWHNADADPSPLAREKLLKVQAEHAQQQGVPHEKADASSGPKRRAAMPPTPPVSTATSTGVVPARRVGG